MQAKLGPESPLDRRGPHFSAGCTKNQIRKPVLKPFCGHVLVLPDSRLHAKVWRDRRLGTQCRGLSSSNECKNVVKPTRRHTATHSTAQGAYDPMCKNAVKPMRCFRRCMQFRRLHDVFAQIAHRQKLHSPLPRVLGFLGFGATDSTEPYKLIWLGGIHGPHPMNSQAPARGIFRTRRSSLRWLTFGSLDFKVHPKYPVRSQGIRQNRDFG